MSIIKTCGGYDKAKIYVEQFKKLNIDGAVKLFEDELLEYRRANNIFEDGDVVGYEGKLYEIKYIYHNDRARITDGFHGKTIYDFPNGIRHATDIEIAQGYRA